MDPEKKVALVTGGSKRLGKYISIALAEAGYNIVLNYKDSFREAKTTKLEIESLGQTCILVKADVSRENQVKKMISRTMRSFKRVDIVINNAAIFQEGNLAKTTYEMWKKTIDTNQIKSINWANY